MTDGPARFRADARTRSGRRKGQAMVETVVVMFFLCLVFFLVYEYANLLTAHTVVNYAAARAARGPGCIPLPGCAAAARYLPGRNGRKGPAAFPAG